LLKAGKLDSELLKKLIFDKIKPMRPEVMVRPGIGEDCAVVDFGEYECVMSTDPITASISDIGRLAIHVSCNDIASNGLRPIGIMLAVMLPLGTTEAQIEKMMEQAAAAAEAIGVEIIGGHTEITPAVAKPVIVSTAIGRGEKWASQKAEDMEEGDHLLLTKSAGMEGTGIIACDYEEELKEILSAEELAAAKAMLNRVSVVEEGVLAAKIGTHGMHDITEGGLLGAVWEMCHISGLGACIQVDCVPVDPVTRKICRHYEIEPLRLISSGCMLIVAAEDKAENIISTVRAHGIDIVDIGRITGTGEKVSMQLDREVLEIQPPAADELYKVVGR